MPVGHYENFPVASFLVPRAQRGAVVALYRFARAADDLADEGDAAPEARLAALAGFSRQLDAIGEGQPEAALARDPVHGPVFAPLAAELRRHALPLAPLHDLLSAFSQDVTTTRYPDWSSVDDYCARSANPVGRMLLALYGAGTPADLAASDAICTALQLANFWQDVAVDWRKGRVYIPQDRLAAHGLDDPAIARQVAAGVEAGEAGARWRALMRELTDDARARFARGRALPAALPWRQGLELSAVIAGGRRILARIDAVDGDVFGRRPTLSARDWLHVMARALVPA